MLGRNPPALAISSPRAPERAIPASTLLAARPVRIIADAKHDSFSRPPASAIFHTSLWAQLIAPISLTHNCSSLNLFSGRRLGSWGEGPRGLSRRLYSDPEALTWMHTDRHTPKDLVFPMPCSASPLCPYTGRKLPRGWGSCLCGASPHRKGREGNASEWTWLGFRVYDSISLGNSAS